MKTMKRNAVIIAVLVFVCAAVYLNWTYNQNEQVIANDPAGDADNVGELSDNAAESSEPADTGDETASGDGLYFVSEEATSISSDLKEYFDAVRLNRKQARDEAADTLNTIATLEGTSQESVDSAVEQMAVIAAWTLQESELENMIMAKGFLDCVAYISENGISVTVAAPDGLSSVDVAKITDIVLAETDFTAEQLKIVEYK